MHRYNDVANLILENIVSGALREGDRLPSVREMSRITGYSAVTVHHGYEVLESQGICQARPRSGFYVGVKAAGAKASKIIRGPEPSDARALDFYDTLLLPQRHKHLETFGATYLSDDLVKRATADKVMRQVLRNGSSRLSENLQPDGDVNMRREICRHIAKRGTFAQMEEVIITGSAIQACNLCLDTFTEPGDVVLVESPTYFPMLATLKRRNLKVIEVHSHPITGVDPQQFAHVLRTNKVKVALLMVTNHYPTGVTYSGETMKQLVEAAEANNVIIVENDMFGDLSYGTEPRVTLKHFDHSGSVVQIGSFECTLPPEYGYGWVVGGRHKRDLLVTHYFNGHRLRDGFVQWGISQYLAGRSYDRQLRTLGLTLAGRMEAGLAILSEILPDACTLSQPTGGFMCWVRIPFETDVAAISNAALDFGVSILPGTMFSVTDAFHHFVALNFSFPWSRGNMDKLRKLGTLITAQIGTPR